MSRFFLMFLLLTFLFSFPLNEKMGNALLPDAEIAELTDTFSDVYFAEEKLEITSCIGQKYVWHGTVIQDDEGMSQTAVKKLLQAQIENDNFCVMHSDEILLHFADGIPKSIKVYNHFYMDEKTSTFIYPELQKCYSIDNVKSTETLHIGMDLASPLASDSSSKYYRVLRLICKYDSQIIEYYFFFR